MLILSGLGVGLSLAGRGSETLSTIKGQVSALAVFSQRPLDTHSLVRTFIQGVCDMVTPVRSLLPPWELNLVLSALQKPLFESIWNFPLLTLLQNVAFLVAIALAQQVLELAVLSCKPPYLILHKDKMVLQPPSFFPYEGDVRFSFQ